MANAIDYLLFQAMQEMREEAAERITRFIRYVGTVNRLGGDTAATISARAFSGKTKNRKKAAKAKKARRRDSFKKKAQDKGRESVSTGVTLMEGYLDKKNRKKVWQSRYFELAGHYLKYYATAAKGDVKAVANVEDLEVAESCGDLEMRVVGSL